MKEKVTRPSFFFLGHSDSRFFIFQTQAYWYLFLAVYNQIVHIGALSHMHLKLVSRVHE